MKIETGMKPPVRSLDGKADRLASGASAPSGAPVTPETAELTLEQLEAKRKEWLKDAVMADRFSDLVMIGTQLGHQVTQVDGINKHDGAYYLFEKDDIELFVVYKIEGFNAARNAYNNNIHLCVRVSGMVAVGVALYAFQPEFIENNPANVYVPGQWESKIMAFKDQAQALSREENAQIEEARKVALRDRLLIGKSV